VLSARISFLLFLSYRLLIFKHHIIKKKEKKKKGFKRELIEWGAILSVLGILYVTGLHTEVIGGLQRVLLWTGIITPNIEMEDTDIVDASYNLPLLTLDEDQFSFSEFKGKTVFLNFWATWCPPCIAEMPNIQALYDDIDDNENIVFVMVSLDEDKDKARSFLKRKDFTMPVYFLNGRKPGVYDSSVVPTTYIISSKGKIVSERRGMANYNTRKFKKFLRSL